MLIHRTIQNQWQVTGLWLITPYDCQKGLYMNQSNGKTKGSCVQHSFEREQGE